MTRRSHPSALEGLMALMQLCTLVLSVPARIQEAQECIDRRNARAERDRTRAALDRARLAESTQKQAIAEQEGHLRSNKVVLADLDIEIKKLQLLKLQNELGLNAPEFKPDNYGD